MKKRTSPSHGKTHQNTALWVSVLNALANARNSPSPRSFLLVEGTRCRPFPPNSFQLGVFAGDCYEVSSGAHPSEVDDDDHNSSLLTIGTTVPPGRGATPAASEL